MAAYGQFFVILAHFGKVAIRYLCSHVYNVADVTGNVWPSHLCLQQVCCHRECLASTSLDVYYHVNISQSATNI